MTDLHAQRWPERPLGAVETLLTAAEGYPALERAMLDARETARLWFRVFDPLTQLRSDEAKAAGLVDWRDLIAHRLDAGVSVDLTISDFDPVGGMTLHEAAWRAAEALKPLRARDAFTLRIALHPMFAGLAWRFAAWPMALWRIERLRRALKGEGGAARLAVLPGLSPWLIARRARVVWRGAGLPSLRPATHHQKVAVFDARRAVIGGLDVDPRRYDDPSHDRPASQTWRDVSVAVEGAVAADIDVYLRRLAGEDVAPAPAAPGPVEGPSIRLSVTLSTLRGGPFTLAPAPVRRDLEADHLDLIAGAEKLLYIETQFLRSRRIAAALAARARKARDLQLILVLPAAPEPVAFGDGGMGARLGEHLQARCVRAAARAFSGRVAVVSPARAAVSHSDGRDALYGAPIVYVHSKVMIADDRRAIVSSANLNGRSLRWDTEAGVVIDGADYVASLRRRLFETLLPKDAPEEAFGLAPASQWVGVATRNASMAPERRSGLILPYRLAAAARYGASPPPLPEEMV